jgi:hypothetical protein
MVMTCALFGSFVSATTIASVGKPDPSFPWGFLVNEQEALSVSWTQANSYTNVSIYAPLPTSGANDSNPVYAYLTSRSGSGTTQADEIARSLVYFSTAPDPTVQLFSGLTLGPGTYYLTLWSPTMAGGGWSAYTDPVTSLDQGVSIGASRESYRYVGLDSLPWGYPYPPSGLYIPEAIFRDDLWNNEHLGFSLVAVEVSAAPEPQTVWLTGVSAALLCGLVRMKRKRLA